MTDFGDIRVITEPSQEYLNERQLVDYRSRREDCIKWLLTFGKDPEKVDGYAQTTVKARSARMDYEWKHVVSRLPSPPVVVILRREEVRDLILGAKRLTVKRFDSAACEGLERC